MCVLKSEFGALELYFFHREASSVWVSVYAIVHTLAFRLIGFNHNTIFPKIKSAQFHLRS